MNNLFILNPSISILKHFVSRKKTSWKIFWTLNFILILSLFILYIIQVNSLAKETYQIQSYQQEIEKLTQENEYLLSDAVKLSSLSNIETIINNSGFEKAQKIHYIQVQEKQVVTK